jgi:hypothetical protein
MMQMQQSIFGEILISMIENDEVLSKNQGLMGGLHEVD